VHTRKSKVESRVRKSTEVSRRIRELVSKIDFRVEEPQYCLIKPPSYVIRSRLLMISIAFTTLVYVVIAYHMMSQGYYGLAFIITGVYYVILVHLLSGIVKPPIELASGILKNVKEISSWALIGNDIVAYLSTSDILVVNMGNFLKRKVSIIAIRPILDVKRYKLKLGLAFKAFELKSRFSHVDLVTITNHELSKLVFVNQAKVNRIETFYGEFSCADPEKRSHVIKGLGKMVKVSLKRPKSLIDWQAAVKISLRL